MSAARLAAFPWARVPQVQRAALATRRALWERLSDALDPARLIGALEDLLGAGARAEVVLIERAAIELSLPPQGAWHVLFSGHGLRLVLAPEPELLRACVARLLAQPFELGWGDAEVDAPLCGAGAALALEVLRRAARTEAPRLVLEPELGCQRDPAFSLQGAASVWLGDAPYRLHVGVEPLSPTLPPRRREAAPRVGLEKLGELALRVPWVCALSTASVEDVSALAPGDVWLPGAGAWLGSGPPASAGLLAPPGAARGLPAHVSGDKIVLGGNAKPLHEELESRVAQDESEISQIVGETPVVVRLEIGAVELSAAEWAALRPGDVVQSGRRIEEGVILRVSGSEIARGELVEIEGEVGVRITQVGSARAGA